MENQSDNNQDSVKISEEPKKKLWTIIGVIILVLLVSTTLFIAYQNYMLRQALTNCKSSPDSLVNENKGLEKTEEQQYCQVNSDCVIGINLDSCCPCPEAINKYIINKEDWVEYKTGKRYLPREGLYCIGEACAPCEPLGAPVCKNNTCQFKQLVESSSQQGKLQVCPDEWYDNQMPPVEPSEQTQYFIINSERRELSEFDLNWIEQNCNIKPQKIY